MKTLVPNYYILKKPKRGLWAEYFREAFLLLNWSLSFVLRRFIINIALGPNEVKPQKPIHVMFLTDDRTEKGSVIINVLPSKPSKNYFDKMPRFSNKVRKRQLSFNNPAHKAHVDTVIDEMGRLLEGKSSQDKCANKKFAIEDLHIKGLERLDKQLVCYFKEQVRQKYNKEFFEKPRAIKLDFYTLETSDDAILESVEVSNNNEKEKPISERKFLITCMARNQNYMYWLKDFYTSAQNIGCTVIGFNYRGIDYSKGMIWTQENIVDDVLAQTERLLQLGVKPENIAFEGMSMGGAVATIAAAKMHDKGFKVKLYNERSYRSLIRLIIGYVMPASNSNPWNPLNWLKYMIVGLTYVTLAPIIIILGWHLDAASAWNKIPHACKNYSLARNHENSEQYDDDDLVHDSFASIASLMAEHVEQVKQKQKDNTAELSIEEQQLLADKAECHEFTLDRNIKENPTPSSHSAPRRFLFDTKKHQTTMQTYMIESLRKTLGINPSKLDSSITL